MQQIVEELFLQPTSLSLNRGLEVKRQIVEIKIEYWRDNWTVSDVTGHAGVTRQYLANAIISDK